MTKVQPKIFLCTSEYSDVVQGDRLSGSDDYFVKIEVALLKFSVLVGFVFAFR